MNPTFASFSLLLVVVMCGYVVSNTPDNAMKIVAFAIGITAAGLSFYLYWRKP